MKLHPEQQIEKEKAYFNSILTKERSITKWAITDYYEPDDVNFISATTNGNLYIMAELKERNGNYNADFIEKYGALIHLKKINSLKEKAEKIKKEKGIDIVIMYMMKSSDGVTFVYNLSDEIEDKVYTKAMQFENGSKRMVEKQNINLTKYTYKWI